MKIIRVTQYKPNGVAMGETSVALHRVGDRVDLFVGEIRKANARHYSFSLADLVELLGGNITLPELNVAYGAKAVKDDGAPGGER